MGCSSCGKGADGAPTGCGDKGNCSTGGCNKRNTYDWLSAMDIYDPHSFEMAEVSFKKGSRKEFFKAPAQRQFHTGDMVLVEAAGGFDVGQISLSGELVRLQLKKKRVAEEAIEFEIIRKANTRDLEKLSDARKMEQEMLVRARVISRTLGLEMKIGDVEYRGDKRKATFYYTAEGRVDFRELVRDFAKEFKIKIEMRQIGARQESARIGGLGSCGRELCCSTWLSNFKSVSTGAARYQNLSINQTKLSGQCGRLKCCLNYELDTYMDALSSFPKKANHLHVEAGKASLVKMDIFKGIMYYSYSGENRKAGIIAVPKDRVKEIIQMNKKGEKPEQLVIQSEIYAEATVDFDDDLTGVIELPNEKRKSRNRNKNRRKKSNKGGDKGKNTDQKQRRSGPKSKSGPKKGPSGKKNNGPAKGERKPNSHPKSDVKKTSRPKNRRRPNRKPRPKNPESKTGGDTPKE